MTITKRMGLSMLNFWWTRKGFADFWDVAGVDGAIYLPAEGQRRSSFHTGNPSDQNTHGEG